MKKFREPESREQINLIPRSVEEFVPEDDFVRYVDALVNELKLSKIKRKYSHFGRPAYSPTVLVKLLVYGKMRGVRSSRALATAARENLKFMFLCSNEKPDFRTISLFRKRFHQELAHILGQTIAIGLREGLIDLKHVAIDASMIRGFAGENSYQTPEKIEREIVELEKFLKESLRKDIETDISDEDDDDPDEKPLPPGFRTKKERVERLKAALGTQERYMNKPPKVSVTDPECRYMRKGPCYNVQAAVDESSRMVVGGYATNVNSENSQLLPVVKDVERNTGSNPEVVTADRGYSEKSAYSELERRNIVAYVPQRAPQVKGYQPEKFKYERERDRYLCPGNRYLTLISRQGTKKIYRCEDCTGCALRVECLRVPDAVTPRSLGVSVHADSFLRMKKRAESPEGKMMAKKRSSTVEPLFGHLKYARKLQRFIFRGLNMINSMWQFELAVYNLEKLIKEQRSRELQLAS